MFTPRYFLALSLLLAGCSQPPAGIVHKGTNQYTMQNVTGYRSIAKDESYAVEPATTMVRAIETKEIAPIEQRHAGLFVRPVEGPEVSKFGDAAAGALADGINIESRKGTLVKAAAAGEVVFVGDRIKTYGTMVIIKHESRLNTTYAHLGSASVKKGDKVAQGETIGTVGDSGAVTTPQLHFAVRTGATPRNPADYLPKQSAAIAQ